MQVITIEEKTEGPSVESNLQEVNDSDHIEEMKASPKATTADGGVANTRWWTLCMASIVLVVGCILSFSIFLAFQNDRNMSPNDEVSSCLFNRMKTRSLKHS
jgi:hypothetical protein